MKEIIRPELTNEPQKPYSKEEIIFPMTMEGNKNMDPANSNPTGPEHAENIPKASEASRAEAIRLLEMLDNLPVEIRNALNEIRREGAAVGGAGRGGEGRPPTPPPPGEEPEPGYPSEGQNGQEREVSIKDRRAAELIERFKREHGENDPTKAQQFSLDLSKRIKELEAELDELGAREGSIILEGDSRGALTPEAAAATREINNRITEIQTAKVDAFIASQTAGGRERVDPGSMLAKEADEFVKSLLVRGLKANQINDLSKLTEVEKATRERLVEEIKNFLKDKPAIDTAYFPHELLSAVRYFTELREELISEILFKSYEDKTETNEYEVGLYASSNLDILLGFLNQDDKERYSELFSLRTAARFFHSMNGAVIKGRFDHFGEVAENINYKHFENMRDIGGSGLAMRLYEQAYKDVLAKDKNVMQFRMEGANGIHAFVERAFRADNEAGLIRSQYSKYRTDSKMEDWEVQRALAAGRAFINITLRAAENIATGQVPTDRRKLSSEPQEDMVRIINWKEWLLRKFGPGDLRHGVEFLDMTTVKFQEFLRYKGAKLDKNKIEEFGGVNVKKLEDGGQYKTSGVFSGWRMENIAFNEVYFNYKGRRISVQQFMDTPDIREKLKKMQKKIADLAKKYPDKDPKDLVTEEDQAAYRELLMPVVNNLNFGLSMLLKNGDFGAQDNKLGYLLREQIWKKVALTNIPLMIDYLTDIKYEAGTPEQDMARSMEALRSDLVPQWSEEQWEAFRAKIMIRHERMIQEGMGEELPPIDEEHKLNTQEDGLRWAIEKEGVKMAPHLADIVFPYMPFMNDMPFEKFTYVNAGQTFYKRRTTGDLGGYNTGQKAFQKIMMNPGGLEFKAVIEAMGEIVAGVEGPEGPKGGIEANFPTLSAYMDLVEAKPWMRQDVVKALLEFTRSPTSIAQEWAGMKADSHIEAESANAIDHAEKIGLLTSALARYLKKEKHLGLIWILWMLGRDILPFIGAFATSELVTAVKAK